jgi:hypothetical protein
VFSPIAVFVGATAAGLDDEVGNEWIIIKILSLPHPASFFLFLLGLLQIFSFPAGFCCLYRLLQKLVVESSRVSVLSPVVLSRYPESVVDDDDDDSSIIGSPMIPPVWVLQYIGSISFLGIRLWPWWR